eukprot:jgi/Orpsp1_1/1177334/evm.model.c7180000061036.1
MYMVILLHILGNGGINSNCKRGTLNFATAFFIETAAYCAVNVFGMISGYLIINSKNCNGLKIIPLWLTVVFYSSIITSLFKFVPAVTNLNPNDKITISALLKASFLPSTSRQYWYFTSYFCLYQFIPYINKLLHSISKKEHQKIVIIIILLFCLSPLIEFNRVDTYDIKNGYSAWWLGCLYIIGAYVKLYPIKISKLLAFAIYLISVLCAWVVKLFTDDIIFLDYDSIFIVISAVSLLLIFVQVEITNERLQKLIVLGSSLSFSVYLIHVQPKVYSYCRDKFVSFSKDPAYLLALKVFASAFSIYMVTSIIDLFRYYLFKYLNVNRLPKIIENKLSDIKNKRKENRKSSIHHSASNKSNINNYSSEENLVVNINLNKTEKSLNI